MPNLNNYESNIVPLESQYSRYKVSRIVSNPMNNLLELEVPTTIPENYFIEISLYSYANNQLVFNGTINPTDENGLITITTVQYSDSSFRTLLSIDFSKTDLKLPDGRFELTLNFFIPEIGSISNKPLILNKISPSRTEVEVQLAPQYKTPISASNLTNFASPQINKNNIIGVLRQIFNQPDSIVTNLQTDNTTLTYDILYDYFSDVTKTRISESKVINSQYENVLTGSIQTFLNSAYMFALESVTTSTATRFTDKMIINIISSSLVQAKSVAASTEIILL